MVSLILPITLLLIAWLISWTVCAHVYKQSAGTMNGMRTFAFRCHLIALPISAIVEATICILSYLAGHFNEVPWAVILALFGAAFLPLTVFTTALVGVYSAGFRRWPFDRDVQKVAVPPDKSI